MEKNKNKRFMIVDHDIKEKIVLQLKEGKQSEEIAKEFSIPIEKVQTLWVSMIPITKESNSSKLKNLDESLEGFVGAKVNLNDLFSKVKVN